MRTGSAQEAGSPARGLLPGGGASGGGLFLARAALAARCPSPLGCLPPAVRGACCAALPGSPRRRCQLARRRPRPGR